MSKSEDQVLEELLGSRRSGCLARIVSGAFSVATLAVLLVLSILILREIHLSEQDAYQAHRAERRVQDGLTAAHEVQTASAEQFLSFNTLSGPDPCATRSAEGPPDPAACHARIDQLVHDAVQGHFIGIGDLRSLRMYMASPARDPGRQELAEAVIALNSLERWVVPLATEVDRFVSDPYYVDLVTTVDRAPSSGVWPALRARVHALPLQVAGTPQARRPFCEQILWNGSERLDISADDSLEVLTWQAECLRKEPSLIDRSFTSRAAHPDQVDEADQARRATAMTEGRRTSEAMFKAAVAAIETPGTTRTRAVCGIDLDEQLTVGLRTFSTIAARAYNGLSMILISQEPTEDTLDAARTAILKAVCFRQEAKQTPAVQAGSQENLAVIAYQRAQLALQQGNEAAAWHAFKESRCEAERAVRDNPLLPWSWTIIYITETAMRSPWSEEQIDCEAMFAMTDARYRRRAIPAIWRQLTFFAPSRFAPDELPSLLPLPEQPSPFNETGYDTLDELLEVQAEEWARLDAQENDVWTEILGLPEQLGTLIRTGM